MTEQDKNDVKTSLEDYRKDFNLQAETNNWSIEEKRIFCAEYFNRVIPEWEKKYLTKKEIFDGKLLPDDVRLLFYTIFPEHGLNMARKADALEEELARVSLTSMMSMRHN